MLFSPIDSASLPPLSCVAVSLIAHFLVFLIENNRQPTSDYPIFQYQCAAPADHVLLLISHWAQNYVLRHTLEFGRHVMSHETDFRLWYICSHFFPLFSSSFVVYDSRLHSYFGMPVHHLYQSVFDLCSCVRLPLLRCLCVMSGCKCVCSRISVRNSNLKRRAHYSAKKLVCEWYASNLIGILNRCEGEHKTFYDEQQWHSGRPQCFNLYDVNRTYFCRRSSICVAPLIVFRFCFFARSPWKQYIASPSDKTMTCCCIITIIRSCGVDCVHLACTPIEHAKNRSFWWSKVQSKIEIISAGINCPRIDVSMSFTFYRIVHNCDKHIFFRIKWNINSK